MEPPIANGGASNRMKQRYDPTVEDPLIPDPLEFQYMALGYVQRRIRLLHIVLFGSGIYLASGATLLMRWLTRVEPWGAALMTDFGILVLLVSLAAAGVAALARIRPSVAFAVADQSIRNDKKTSIILVVLGAIYSTIVVLLAWGPELPRVSSILFGMWVGIAIGVLGLLRARYMRLHRDELYSGYLSRHGKSSGSSPRTVRDVVPGPSIIDSEPSGFELQAFGYAGKRSRGWALVLMGPFLTCFLAPILGAKWALGEEYDHWIVPVLVAAAIMAVCCSIGAFLLKLDLRGKPAPAKFYAKNLSWSARANRGSAIAGYVGSAAIFISGVLIARSTSDPEFVIYVFAFAIGMASLSPFMLTAGNIMNRRRELYAAWLIRNDKITVDEAHAQKPQNWDLER
ncbi:hypothetical protein FQ154_11475 [Paeniglutamicibacter gangotriensis]|uniref:Uncharacterized protein n=1 Tax=Paeniglutamicibacter gangotriensis TaxID=254787 RepID=A0A5B0EFY7_9MICC|nr:hypothetical protein [Paeniglutamicibacter gangotriensis]KAA0976209.1 hypothetical protein FQ154_11475 [Paeniglutamicibacter gangotriensis]